MGNVFRIAGNSIKGRLKLKVNILVYIVIPPVLAVLFMMLVSSGQSSSIAIGVSDADKSESSRQLVEYLVNNDKYIVEEFSAADLETAVGKKDVRAGINIPAGFENYLRDGSKQVLVEVMSIEGVAVTGWLRGFLEQKISILYKAGRLLDDADDYDRVITEYKDRYVTVESIEVTDISNKVSGTRAGFGMYTFASLFGIWAICALGFREKVHRTYQRIMSGPVSPWQYMTGHIMACMFFAAIHAIVSITVMYNVFNLAEVLPLGQFIILITVFYIAAIPFGLFLVSLGKSESAVMAVNVVFLTLTCMLGGCYWEVEWMPDAMQKMARGTIQFWFTDGIAGLMKGNGLSEISTNLIVLAGCGVVFIFLYVIIENSKKNRMAV